MDSREKTSKKGKGEDGYTGSVPEERWAWEALQVRRADTNSAPPERRCAPPEESSSQRSSSAAAGSAPAPNACEPILQNKPTNSAENNTASRHLRRATIRRAKPRPRSNSCSTGSRDWSAASSYALAQPHSLYQKKTRRQQTSDASVTTVTPRAYLLRSSCTAPGCTNLDALHFSQTNSSSAAPVGKIDDAVGTPNTSLKQIAVSH